MPWKINLDEVPKQHQVWNWAGAQYERTHQHISVALGNTKESPHPFDVELTHVPPGAAPCPVHSHTRWWEFFIVVSGQGEISRNGELFEVGPGDCFIQPPNTQHRIRNRSQTEDLVYYVITNEDPASETTKHQV
ncbi:MAG: cupin domain-containing protein [Candidatus Latescibacteria bacterium]|nr:cupin domain-containing protein [Candidatus Latescibacterota bacterium]